MLASTALGPALSSKNDTNKSTSPQPSHFIVRVHFYKGSSSEGYDPYLTQVDQGATY